MGEYSNFNDRLLIEYLPTVLKDVRSFQAIMHTEQPEIYNYFEQIETAIDNQFITTLTEYGIERWEKILSITPKMTYTLDERRFAILAAVSKSLPYTLRALEQMLTVLCGQNGYEVVLTANEYLLTIKIALAAKNKAHEVNVMAGQLCPANLIINVMLMYNTWGSIRGFTWGQLSKKTWDEIKREVM